MDQSCPGAVVVSRHRGVEPRAVYIERAQRWLWEITSSQGGVCANISGMTDREVRFIRGWCDDVLRRRRAAAAGGSGMPPRSGRLTEPGKDGTGRLQRGPGAGRRDLARGRRPPVRTSRGPIGTRCATIDGPVPGPDQGRRTSHYRPSPASVRFWSSSRPAGGRASHRTGRRAAGYRWGREPPAVRARLTSRNPTHTTARPATDQSERRP